MCAVNNAVRRCVWSKYSGYQHSYQIRNLYNGNILMTHSTDCDWEKDNGGRVIMDSAQTVRNYWKAAPGDDGLLDSLVVNRDCLPEVSATDASQRFPAATPVMAILTVNYNVPRRTQTAIPTGSHPCRLTRLDSATLGSAVTKFTIHALRTV